ncbi:unnamed protein product [Owenia fusiformis]|uniref:Uncharacterized protein n=1 Tax=Owenia fusiformis TaxID=6347 RepID=A0A8J1XLX5_OWEFU|nr:unnamed protein product [Owenia fusiformis]
MEWIVQYFRPSYYIPLRPVHTFEEWMFGHNMLTVYFLLFTSWLNFTNEKENELGNFLYDININPGPILEECRTVQDIVDNPKCFNPAVNQQRENILDAMAFKGKLIHNGITERAIQQCIFEICDSVKCIDRLLKQNLNVERLKNCHVTVDMLIELTTNSESDTFYNTVYMESLNWTFGKAMSEYSCGIFGFCTYVLVFVFCQILVKPGNIVGNIRLLEEVESEMKTPWPGRERLVCITELGLKIILAIVYLIITLACYGWDNTGFLVIVNVCFHPSHLARRIYIEPIVHVLIVALWMYSMFQCLYAWYMSCFLLFGLILLKCMLMLSETHVSVRDSPVGATCSIDAKRLFQVPCFLNQDIIHTTITDVLMVAENGLGNIRMELEPFVGKIAMADIEKIEYDRLSNQLRNNSRLCKSLSNVRLENINSSELINKMIVPSLRNNTIESIEIIDNYDLTDECDLISDVLIAENRSLKVLEIRFEPKSGFQHMFHWLCYGPRSNIQLTSVGVEKLLQGCVQRLETAPLNSIIITGYTPGKEYLEYHCAQLRFKRIYVFVEP